MPQRSRRQSRLQGRLPRRESADRPRTRTDTGRRKSERSPEVRCAGKPPACWKAYEPYLLRKHARSHGVGGQCSRLCRLACPLLQAGWSHPLNPGPSPPPMSTHRSESQKGAADELERRTSSLGARCLSEGVRPCTLPRGALTQWPRHQDGPSPPDVHPSPRSPGNCRRDPRIGFLTSPQSACAACPRPAPPRPGTGDHAGLSRARLAPGCVVTWKLRPHTPTGPGTRAPLCTGRHTPPSCRRIL